MTSDRKALDEAIAALEENIAAVEDYSTRLRVALAVLKGDEVPPDEVMITLPINKRVWEWLAEAFGYPLIEMRAVIERWYADEMANEESMRVSER